MKWALDVHFCCAVPLIPARVSGFMFWCVLYSKWKDSILFGPYYLKPWCDANTFFSKWDIHYTFCCLFRSGSKWKDYIVQVVTWSAFVPATSRPWTIGHCLTQKQQKPICMLFALGFCLFCLFVCFLLVFFVVVVFLLFFCSCFLLFFFVFWEGVVPCTSEIDICLIQTFTMKDIFNLAQNIWFKLPHPKVSHYFKLLFGIVNVAKCSTQYKCCIMWIIFVNNSLPQFGYHSTPISVRLLQRTTPWSRSAVSIVWVVTKWKHCIILVLCIILL